MARRMADDAFRDSQRAQVFAPQVAAVNALCDELMAEKPGSTVPYVAPHYNASTAKILWLSSNPGRVADGADGPQFLSRENDSPSAARMNQVFGTVGLTDSDVLPWNAYPWNPHQEYPNGLPPHLVVEGLEPLKRLLTLYPNIRAIVAHGGDAQRSIRLLTTKKRFADFAAHRGLRVWEARHPAHRVFVTPSPERDAALERLCASYREAMTFAGVKARPAASRSSVPKVNATKSANAVRRSAVKRTLAGSDLVSEVGDVLSGRTDGHTDRQARDAVRAYLATMSPRRRTELLVELVTQRLNS